MNVVKYSERVHMARTHERSEFIWRGRTSLRVRLRHMNQFRIFYDIHLITFFYYKPFIMQWNGFICLFLAPPGLIYISFGHILCKKT